jgi:hypothetical protein
MKASRDTARSSSSASTTAVRSGREKDSGKTRSRTNSLVCSFRVQTVRIGTRIYSSKPKIQILEVRRGDRRRSPLVQRSILGFWMGRGNSSKHHSTLSAPARFVCLPRLRMCITRRPSLLRLSKPFHFILSNIVPCTKPLLGGNTPSSSQRPSSLAPRRPLPSAPSGAPHLGNVTQRVWASYPMTAKISS